MRWDHVVVGAGSSGAVVAARLAEDPARTVLVLEAGAIEPAPGAHAAASGSDFFAALAEPALTWADPPVVLHPSSPPQPYLQGRGLGGTARVNAMVAQRPLPGDLDRWARDLGCPAWDWAAVGPLVARCEGGLEPVGAAERGVMARAWVAGAGVESAVPDPPGEGCAPVLVTRRHGRRWSSGEVLAASLGRANLTVRGDAPVDRVLLDGGRVTGVRLASGEEVEAASVVLCAGALRTPLVLLRSGLDRPGVGEHLLDHPGVGFDLVREVPADPAAAAVAVVERWSSEPGALDLMVTPVEHLRDPARARVGVALLAARSKGSVGLRSADPLDPPLVEPRWLTDERDLERLVAGVVGLAVRLAGLELAGAGLHPAAGVPPLEALCDEATARAWVPTALGGSYHAAGTCRMGAAGDPGAVVDEWGRVHGVAALRVADASVLPDLPRANPHLTCVVVAERVALDLRAAPRGT